MATHSSILAWEIPWTEEPGELQSIVSQSQMHLSTHARAYRNNTDHQLLRRLNKSYLSPFPIFKKEVTGISVGAASGFPLRESETTPQER